MNSFSLTHLADSTLLRDLAALVAKECSTTAAMLAHIGEVDARRLYLPAAHPSMFSYCVNELHLSEGSAYRRITAARAARQFPVLFDSVADGRLHLTAVLLLAPHLTAGNVRDLVQSATHKPKSDIELLLAQRFPRTEELALVERVPLPVQWDEQLAPARVDVRTPEGSTLDATQLAPARVDVRTHEGNTLDATQLAPARVEYDTLRARLAPVATDRYALHATVDQETYDALREAQALLGHRVPTGNLAEVLKLALKSLVRGLEKRKFAATERPQRKRRPSKGVRAIPAHVRREVWERDQGQCTFESEAGKRCPSRTRLEFDHIDEVGRGGEATTERMRLRCRGHNQYTAECTFGAEFMSGKREDARRAAAEKRAAKAQAAADAHEAARGANTREVTEQRETAACAEAVAAAERANESDVIPWLRALGFRADEARRAAAHCELIPHASLEERVRRGLAFLAPRAVTQDFRPAQKTLGTAA